MAAALESAVAAPQSVEAPQMLMALAAPQAEETPAQSEPAVDNGETETEEDYAITAGSATLTINGMPVGGAAYVNDTANNAIRNALLGAVEHLRTDLAEGSDGIVDIRITVGEGTYEGGVDLGASDDANSLRTKLLESLGLTGDGEGPIANISIVAEDAMETDADGNENPTANANGKAVIEGDLIFDGFNTLLAGIYIGMNSKINAANGDRFSYYGTELDDDVDIEVDSVGEVTVDTGDGDDTVTLTVKQEPTTRVDVDSQAIEEIITTEIINYVASGESVEEITSRDSFEQLVGDMVQKITEESVSGSNKRERAKVTVKTGAGDDVADVKVVNATAFDAVDQGVGQTPAYSFAFDLSATDVEHRPRRRRGRSHRLRRHERPLWPEGPAGGA